VIVMPNHRQVSPSLTILGAGERILTAQESRGISGRAGPEFVGCWFPGSNPDWPPEFELPACTAPDMVSLDQVGVSRWLGSDLE
jgi:hypothetical protein